MPGPFLLPVVYTTWKVIALTTPTRPVFYVAGIPVGGLTAVIADPVGLYEVITVDAAEIIDFNATFAPTATALATRAEAQARATATANVYPSGNTVLADRVRHFDLSNPNAFYIGYAVRGTLPAALGWTIQRITFVAGFPTADQWTDVGTAIWDNRAAETYT